MTRLCELAGVGAGQRVLAIGAGPEAVAQLAGQVDHGGHVVAVEPDDEHAEQVRRQIHAAGIGAGRVEVHTGTPDVPGAPDVSRAPDVSDVSGGSGVPVQVGGQFDRIVVAEVSDQVPEGWCGRLSGQGVVTVPLRLHASGLTRLVRLERDGEDALYSTGVARWPYAPGPSALRSLETVTTALGEGVALDHGQAVQRMRGGRGGDTALAEALRGDERDRWQAWLGPWPGLGGPGAEHLDWWIDTLVPRPFARLRVSAAARRAGVADPAPRWGGACVVVPGSCAWVVTDAAAGTDRAGVVAVGAEAAELGAPLLAMLECRRGAGGYRQPRVMMRRAGGARGGEVQVRW